jgi:hypothetical protein
MPTVGYRLEGFVRGDDLDVIRTISGIPAEQTRTDAWLRVDENTPPGVQFFQKHITMALVAGEGQIEDGGSVATLPVSRSPAAIDSCQRIVAGCGVRIIEADVPDPSCFICPVPEEIRGEKVVCEDFPRKR